MSEANNIGEIARGVAQRCSALNLDFDCGPDGAFNSRIAVIAEAPGEREKQLKIPLTGGSGKLFWDMVRPIGLNRRGVYISNTVKRQLRLAGSDEKVEISRGEIDHYIAILQWELSQLPNLEYIVVLGNYALEAVTGFSGILHHRGSVYDVQLQQRDGSPPRRVKVIAMMNPAAIMREPKWEILYKFDIGRLDDVLKGKFKQHEIETTINPSPKEIIDYIDKMQDEGKPVSLDIETIANETACIGLANNRDTAFCANFRDEKTNRFSTQEELEVRLRFQKFGSDPNTQLVMQNGMFDSYWLACKDRIVLRPSHFDTMLAHHTLYPSLPHNLGFLTSQYTTHPFYKDEGKQWKEGGDINSFWKYNGKDCCITYACYERMMKELKDQNLDKFFFEHVMRLQPHLIRMVVGGMLVDLPLKEKIAKEMKEEVERLRQDFFDKVALETGDPLYKPNPGSPKQMRTLMFEKLRLVGRGVSTDVKNRVRMKSHPKTTQSQRDILIAIDKYATERKFAGTYAEMVIDDDDRCRTEYKQTGVAAAPGRLSSSQVMWGSGANLQNQPGRAQKMFIADEGYELSYFDMAQAEARVVGWRAVIPQWMEDFERAKTESGFDAHRSLAATMYKIPYDEVPTEDWEADEVTPTKRYKAKRCRHGLNYTMGPGELAEQISIDLNEATVLHNIYHSVNPELERWWSWTFEQVRTKRQLFNAYGRRWINLERLDPSILGTLVAFYPQSTIGDKVARCIYLCESDPDWPSDARMLLNIHDALIALNRPEDGPTVRSIMKKYAEEPLMIEGMDGKTRELIIPCDFKVSTTTLVRANGELYEDPEGLHRWAGMKKLKSV
jgi:uracil-DNA glycosylase family 4